MLIEASRQQVRMTVEGHPSAGSGCSNQRHWSSMRHWRNLTLPWPSFTLGMTGTGPPRKGSKTCHRTQSKLEFWPHRLRANAQRHRAFPGSDRRRCSAPVKLDPLSRNHQRAQWLPSSPGKTRRRGCREVKRRSNWIRISGLRINFENGLYREKCTPKPFPESIRP